MVSLNTFVKNLLGVLILSFILCSCNVNDNKLLIEAESFKNKGGWVVDPQFVEQMGSPYLLAHGLGTPVENAHTEVQFPAVGNYHIWVRTKNWVPGNWPAPGQFTVAVNHVELPHVLGTIAGWKWQYAGETEITKNPVYIELIDFTGFEGRCDALYFSTKKKSPPNQATPLKEWRIDKTNTLLNPPLYDKYDLVIVGGGIAGCAAAIAAAEGGLQVALIHDRPVLGGNASSEIRVHTEGIPWHSQRIISMINTEHWPNGSPLAALDDRKRHENIEKYENIHLYLQWRAFAVQSEDKTIKAVDARHTETGEILRFQAPLYIDCTGDGWIGYWAGAETMYGRESVTKYNEAWEEHGEVWSSTENDNRVVGSSVLWRTIETDTAVTFPEVPWAMEVAGDHAATQGTWHWEFSRNDVHQINDAEYIRDHMIRAIYGSFYNAKQKPEHNNLKLEWISYLIGKRESRRILGDYIYTFNDVREQRVFPDAVVMEKRPVDVHYQQNLKDPAKPDFLAEAMFYEIDFYYIPYRCLYSKDIDNLFMAGRCFSCSHIGLGGPRVMHTTGQMGVAVGYAAVLCKKYNTSPRSIYQQHIEELKAMIHNTSNLRF